VAQTVAGYEHNKVVNTNSTRNWLVRNRPSKEGSHFPSTVEMWLLCLADIIQTSTEPCSSWHLLRL